MRVKVIENMQVSQIPGKTKGRSFAIEFYEDEIDQLLSFVSAIRILRPNWLDNEVSITGTKPGTIRVRQYNRCVFVSAFSWGYLRTLIARRPDGKEITLGGGNAIVEDLAITSVAFRINADTHDWLTVRRTVTDLIRRMLANDYEERIWKNELWPKTARVGVLKPFEDLFPLLDSKNTLAAHHAACTIFPRLKAIPRLCENKVRTLEKFLEKPIDMALASKEAFLQMHVCECIYWMPFESVQRELKRKIASLLAGASTSSDINVKLAAIVSAAKHGLLSELQLASPLEQLAAELHSSNHPYLRYIRTTCQILLKQKKLLRLSMERKQIAGLLRSLAAKPPNLDKWRRLLGKVKAARTNDEKKKSLESFAQALFASVPYVEFLARDERTHTGEVDLRFRFRRESSDFFENASENVFLVECKHEKEPMDTRSIDSLIGKLTRQNLTKGIIISIKGITGKSGWDGYGVLQHAVAARHITVVVLRLEDLEELVRGSISIQKLMERKCLEAQKGYFS